MGRTGSLLPNFHYRKAAARERQQLARSCPLPTSAFEQLNYPLIVPHLLQFNRKLHCHHTNKRIEPPPLHYQISAPSDAAQRKQEELSGEDFGQSAPLVKAAGNIPPASWFLLRNTGNEYIPVFQ